MLEVDKAFWPDYNKNAGVYCVGEVDNGDVSIACPYQNYLDGVLNYPIYFPLVRAFESSDGSISDLSDMIASVKSDCKDPTLLGSFSENHDNPRFASYTQDWALAKNVLTYTILADGIPIVYAGQEQHYDGGNDPANREATWLSGFNTSAQLYTWVAKLNKIRSYAINLDDGYTTSKVSLTLSHSIHLSGKITHDLLQNTPIYQDNNNLAMVKGSNGTQVVTVVSNVGSSSGQYTLTVQGAGYAAGTSLMDLISCTKVTVQSSGDISVPMSSGLPSVLYPASKLNGTGNPCS